MSEAVCVSVINLGGSAFVVFARPEVDTVRHLQGLIRESAGIDVEEQQLFLDGEELSPTDPRSLCEISENFNENGAASILLVLRQSPASKALANYDHLLELMETAGMTASWKARANCAMMFYALSEKQQCWDTLKLAIQAKLNFRVIPTAEEMYADPDLGKYFRKLNKEYEDGGSKRGRRGGFWEGPSREDGENFMVLLVSSNRGNHIFRDRFDQTLPLWYPLCMEAFTSRFKRNLPNALAESFQSLTWDTSASRQTSMEGNMFHLIGHFKPEGNCLCWKMSVEARRTCGDDKFDFDVHVVRTDVTQTMCLTLRFTTGAQVEVEVEVRTQTAGRWTSSDRSGSFECGVEGTQGPMLHGFTTEELDLCLESSGNFGPDAYLSASGNILVGDEVLGTFISSNISFCDLLSRFVEIENKERGQEIPRNKKTQVDEQVQAAIGRSKARAERETREKTTYEKKMLRAKLRTRKGNRGEYSDEDDFPRTVRDAEGSDASDPSLKLERGRLEISSTSLASVPESTIHGSRLELKSRRRRQCHKSRDEDEEFAHVSSPSPRSLDPEHEASVTSSDNVANELQNSK